MTENARPSTGDPVVDGALAEYDDHADGPLPDRVAAATEAHRRLQQRLADPASSDNGAQDSEAQDGEQQARTPSDGAQQGYEGRGGDVAQGNGA